MAPRSPKLAPRAPKLAPRAPKLSPRGAQDPPSRAQDAPKTLQDEPKRLEQSQCCKSMEVKLSPAWEHDFSIICLLICMDFHGLRWYLEVSEAIWKGLESPGGLLRGLGTPRSQDFEDVSSRLLDSVGPGTAKCNGRHANPVRFGPPKKPVLRT